MGWCGLEATYYHNVATGTAGDLSGSALVVGYVVEIGTWSARHVGMHLSFPPVVR